MPTLTVMEGRANAHSLMDDLRRETEKIGWDFLCLPKINSDKIARCDFSDIPLDFVIFRELTGNNYYETERVLEYVRRHAKKTVNVNVTGGRTCTSDKHYQQGLFMMDEELAQFAMPTYEAKHRENVKAYIKGERAHYPIVLKPRRGSLGKDIILVKNEEELNQIADFTDYLVEQYIEPECDFRVFVMDGKAVGAMRKSGDPDHPEDFQMWCTGKVRMREDDAQVLNIINKIAERAAKISGLDYAGVDILRDKNNDYHLLETNIAASWSNFVPTTGINIPELLVGLFKNEKV